LAQHKYATGTPHMSFQAYLDNIKAKTGLDGAAFEDLARGKGFVADGQLADGVKVTAITDWLKAEYGLGHGHAMAIVAFLKGKRP
jgi:hypothetical protein